jgi:hypothetical protein
MGGQGLKRGPGTGGRNERPVAVANRLPLPTIVWEKGKEHEACWGGEGRAAGEG